MYQVGQFIIYAQEGVCRVEAIGSVDIKGARQDMLYYTLRSLWHQGKVYAPVESEAFSRPVITEAEASALLADIPNAPVQVFENHNPRVLGEIYQKYLKSNDCRKLLELIISIKAKGVRLAARGRRLGMVDERCIKQAEEKLCGEFSVAMSIPAEEVKALLNAALAQTQK